MTISEKIAKFVKELWPEDVPTEVFEAAKAHMLDTVRVALLSGETAPTSAMIQKLAREKEERPECTLWGRQEKTSAAGAVLCNATVIHGLDFDDTHTGAIVHPSASVLAVALAIGEKLHKTGEEILLAAIAGYEVIVRLGLAADGQFHDHGFHPSGILAPFAGVCTAAKLMDLEEDVIVNACGIAGSQAGTIMEFLHDGSWVKMLHPGWGAFGAIYAVDCARAGFTGPRTVFEGQYGVFPTHIQNLGRLAEQIDTLGTAWLTPEIAFKLYPTCHHTHSFINVMTSLMETHRFSAADIRSMRAYGTPMCASQVCYPKEAKVRPETEYMMKFSLYYVLAITALRGSVTTEEIDLKYMNDPEVLEMIDRIEFVEDSSIAVPGHMPAKLEVTLKDGRTFSESQKYEKSARENPITLEDVIRKYHACVSGILPEAAERTVLDVVLNFRGSDAVPRLMAAMAAR